MTSFWNNLPKPFFAMAPMKDVTDAAFRRLFVTRGKPDVFWTEFVSADGLYYMTEKQGDSSRSEVSPCLLSNPLLRDLQFSTDEHPIVAQIFSSKPDMIAYAANLVAKLGFDGIDINMGCPDRAIEKQGAGAALIKNPLLAVELIRAAKEASPLPVSVKTRVGYSKEILDEWLPILLEAAPAAITLHVRTRKELSLAPANWEFMKKAVEIRNKINPNVILIGNGDVENVEEGKRLVSETGCDGIMIGRGMFGNPWIFTGRKSEDTPLADKLAALIELAQNFEKITPPKNFSILKKHIKAFVTGFPACAGRSGAADLRAKLMEANSAGDIERILGKQV